MNDFMKFDSEFLSEEKEILVLIKQTTNGAMKYGEAWRSSNTPMAFIDLQDDKLYAKGCRLEWLVADSKNWKYYFKEKTAYRLKVRARKQTEVKMLMPTFMLVEVLEEDVKNEKFDEILREFEKEVIYEDEKFSLKLDKKWGFFEGKEIGKTHLFSVETEDLDELKRLLEKYETLTQNYDKWLKEMKEFACEKLLDLANQWAKSEDEKAKDITSQEFIKNIKLSSVALDEDECLIAYFDDGDMFFGHAVCVFGSLDGSLRSATIEG